MTDKTTGLMWEKKTGTLGSFVSCATGCTDPHDVNNGYSWSPESPYTEPSGTLFSDFLERLNDLKTPNDGTSTPCFANHCDWRIPTIGELRSILSASAPNCNSAPCIDPAFGPTQASTSYYWSSSSLLSNPDKAWVVSFYNGNVTNGFKGAEYQARAVRGGR